LDAITKFRTAIGGWKFDMTTDVTATKFNDQAFYDELGLEIFTYFQWKAIAGFFGRAWFKRIWVLQEIIHGNPRVVVIGGYMLDFELVWNTVKLISRSGWAIHLASIAWGASLSLSTSQIDGMVLHGVDLIYTANGFSISKLNGFESELHRDLLNLVHGATTPYERRYAFQNLRFIHHRILALQIRETESSPL
jgi:hypothetical protein